MASRGRNPAWLVPIVSNAEVITACWSGSMIRNGKVSEPVVAFVSPVVVTKHIILQLAAVFDQVIVSPGELPCGNLSERNCLLLETLNLCSFSSLIVVGAGTLVGWSFDNTLEYGAITNQEGDWAMVSVAPQSSTYLEAVRSLKNGQPFDLNSITHGDLLDGVSYSWSTLKYYDGLKIPVVSLTPDDVNTLTKAGRNNEDLITTGFWQKAILSQLAPLISSNGTLKDCGAEQQTKNWIAIVGMSCRLPGANSVDEYWQVLTSGMSTASAPSPNRIAKCELKEHMTANYLKCQIDEFDASFFEILPSTAANTDPQARLLLEVSWEAFEDAGINPEKYRAAPVGVFYGSWMKDYWDMLNWDQKSDQDFLKKFKGNGMSTTASQISFFYGFTGPNIATEVVIYYILETCQ